MANSNVEWSAGGSAGDGGAFWGGSGQRLQQWGRAQLFVVFIAKFGIQQQPEFKPEFGWRLELEQFAEFEQELQLGRGEELQLGIFMEWEQPQLFVGEELQRQFGEIFVGVQREQHDGIKVQQEFEWFRFEPYVRHCGGARPETREQQVRFYEIQRVAKSSTGGAG